MCVCVDRGQGEGLSEIGLICPSKWAHLVIRIISIDGNIDTNAMFSIKQLKFQFLTHFHSHCICSAMHTSPITTPSLSIPIDNIFCMPTQ